MGSVNENSNQWKGAFGFPEVQVFHFVSGNKLRLLIGSAQDDVMIEIFFDNAKDSVGMSVESSILTEFQSERLAFEWGRVITGFMPSWRKTTA